MLARHPFCIFCGGNVPATTEDHQPARAFFDRKEWPEGYAFPACEPCNQSSKRDEQILALIVRFDSERADDPQRRADFVKYVRAMRNNFPDLLMILSANQKRQFFKSERLKLPKGTALADLHIAGLDARDSERAFETVLRKIMRALHWKHTGKVAPADDRLLLASWYTSAYLHVLHSSGDFDLFSQLPARPALVRNGRDLSDQFAYRYGVSETQDASVYMLMFRHSVIATGFVLQSDTALREWEAEQALRSSTP